MTAFIDNSVISNEYYLPKLIFNNPSGGQVVLTSIQNELVDVESFSFSIAFITKGGLSCIYNDLDRLEKKGVKGRILTTDFLTFNDPLALRELLKFSNIEVRMFEGDLHTKGYIFDKKDHQTIIVGSSNLTDNALKCNLEWNIRVSSTDMGDIVSKFSNEFNRMWDLSKPLTEDWLESYSKRFIERTIVRVQSPGYSRPIIEPTNMQKKALIKIKEIRTRTGLARGKNRALLISATGTGKTYISAFDVKDAKPKRMLFMVHRGKILRDAMDSYKNVLGENGRTYGFLNANNKDYDSDFLFASVYTLQDHLDRFRPEDFDYIVCDEAHHIVTAGQQKILNYFKPKFILGMTATPERPHEDTDNVYEVFDYNVPYEVRLSDALEEKLVSPFHYFGIEDVIVDGDSKKKSDFNRLVPDERIEKIVYEINRHPHSGDRIRGLIFCSRVEEAKLLEQKLSPYFKVKALDGSYSDDERDNWFSKLEADSRELDFIISVDILNEGVDLPRVNMVIMLRPTQSSIVFIQQLGRGLRKRDDKEFVTILDFIGNYDNNYNIPVALFGDNTRNKENLRRKMILGNNIIPGASSISFDEISKERIFKSINKGKMNYKKELKESYVMASKKIGREPSLCELYEERSLDPRTIIERYDSLNNFKKEIKVSSYISFNETEARVLNEISNLTVNGIRPYESIILKALIKIGKISLNQLLEISIDKFNMTSDKELITNSFFTLTTEGGFVKESLCELRSGTLFPSKLLLSIISNKQLEVQLLDAIDCGVKIFKKEYQGKVDQFGLELYKIYSRTDFCRSINIKKGNDSTLYGYGIRGNYCPLFVIYKKEAGENPMYNDHFIDRNTFYWESRYPRYLNSDELQPIFKSNSNGLNILLFITKDESEDDKFYYCGLVKYIEGTARNAKTISKSGEMEDVVSINYRLQSTIPEDIFDYLTHSIPDNSPSAPLPKTGSIY